MSDDRWLHVQELFHRAAGLPAVDRHSFLTEVEPDPQIRDEVAALLSADAAPFSLMDALPSSLAAAADRAAEGESLDGRVIGPYKLVRLVGKGGMGAVYLAERTDTGNRVALKVIRGALGDDLRVARFHHEQRFLARLEHPHIARFLDAGIAPDGTPYLVLEYVEGKPITEWCNAQSLGIEQRLRLFAQVCEAVHYAHRNLLVHRDLKPSNVFVTAEGGVKLLDFGTAKLTEDDPEADHITATGMRILSPAYAAPEQVRGDPVTTATDVHGLGALLYELLTGERPYAVRGSNPTDLAAAVLETDVRRPSVVVHRREDKGSGHGIPLTREALARRIAGDLDAICLRALEKEPERRYRSAEQLRGDVLRYLDGHPVQARLPTMAYRMGKFVRRHAAGVAVASALVLSLSGGLAASLWQAREARAARDEAQEASAFLVELFRASDPNETLGEDVTARTLLERGAVRVAELDDRPLLQARMLDAIARAYYGLGDYKSAERFAEQGLQSRIGLLGNSHEDIAQSRVTLGLARIELGEIDSGIQLMREGLEVERRVHGARDDRTTATMLGLGVQLRQLGSLDEAEGLAREAVAARTAVHGTDAPSVAEAMEELALTLSARDRDLEEAESLLREALAIRQRSYDDEDPRVERALVSLAGFLSFRGDPTEAESMARRGIELRRRIYGDDHPLVTHAMNNLATAVGRQHRYDESTAIYHEMLRRYQSIPGDHVMVATALNNIGANFYALAVLDSSAHYQSLALDIRARLDPNVTPSLAMYRHNLGAVRRALGQLESAERVLRTAYENRVELFGEDGPATLRTGSELGNVMIERGKSLEAEDFLRGILQYQRDQADEVTPDAGRTMGYVAHAMALRGAHQEADELFLPALEALRRAYAPTHPRRTELVERVVRHYEAWGRPVEAALIRQSEDSLIAR